MSMKICPWKCVWTLVLVLHFSQAENPTKRHIGGDEPRYSFSYEVKDGLKHLDFQATQSREQGKTTGSYSVLLPDGRLQTVTYKDVGQGLIADVTYEHKESFIPHETYSSSRPNTIQNIVKSGGSRILQKLVDFKRASPPPPPPPPNFNLRRDPVKIPHSRILSSRPKNRFITSPTTIHNKKEIATVASKPPKNKSNQLKLKSNPFPDLFYPETKKPHKRTKIQNQKQETKKLLLPNLSKYHPTEQKRQEYHEPSTHHQVYKKPQATGELDLPEIPKQKLEKQVETSFHHLPPKNKEKENPAFFKESATYSQTATVPKSSGQLLNDLPLVLSPKHFNSVVENTDNYLPYVLAPKFYES